MLALLMRTRTAVVAMAAASALLANLDSHQISSASAKPPIAVTVRSLDVDHSDPNPAGAHLLDGPVPTLSVVPGDPPDPTPAPHDSFPSRAIVHIISSEGHCTGWLFGPRILATAGHCVNRGRLPGNDHAWADLESMRIASAVTDGDHGIVASGESCGARRLYASPGWIESGAADQDFGAIELAADCRLGRQRGWLGVGSSTAAVAGASIRVTGFMKTDRQRPCVNFGDEAATYATCMWASVVTGTHPGRLLFEADTHPGDSGSPVVSSACAACAIAILTGRSTDPGASSIAREAVLISQSAFELLMAWRNVRE